MTASTPARATLNYSIDNGIPPDYYFYEPDASVKLNPPGTDPRQVEIHDGWPEAGQMSVDREGFELRSFTERFDQFDDDDSVKQVFYRQVIDFVQQHTGAKRVEVFDHTIRKRLPADLKQQTSVQRPAVLLVHSDYTVLSGPQRVRDVVPADAEVVVEGYFHAAIRMLERAEGHEGEVIIAKAVVEATVDGNDYNMLVKLAPRELVALNALISAFRERFITAVKE